MILLVRKDYINIVTVKNTQRTKSVIMNTIYVIIAIQILRISDLMVVWILSNYIIVQYTNPRMFKRMKTKVYSDVTNYVERIPMLNKLVRRSDQNVKLKSE